MTVFGVGRLLLLVLLTCMLGGMTFLAQWDIPPPIKQVERVFPNDLFPR